MHDPQDYDRPPMYSPPYSTTPQALYPPISVHSFQRQYVSCSYSVPPDSYHVQENPQLFYRWFSPAGLVKTFQGATVLMCFIIFACVASTLVWDMNGFEYRGYRVAGTALGYYGTSYAYSGTYMTPQSAKAAMISMASINFLVSLGFLVASFSRSGVTRGCRFYFIVFVCDAILAVLQGIIGIIYVIGVNPMSLSSQGTLYNPVLTMCQSMQGKPSLSGSFGAGFPGEFPMYNQYLYHYCYMDPQEIVALALGVLVVLSLSLSAYYAYKTRSKIWRHGKANIYWDKRQVNRVGETPSTQQAPTVASAPELRMENSIVSYSNGTASIHSEPNHNSNSSHQDTEPPLQNNRVTVSHSSSSNETEGLLNPRHGREKRKSPEFRPAQHTESQYETGYTTGDTGNELDGHTNYLHRLYPEIISDEQRRQYKTEFDSDLTRYKTLCAEMDEISDHVHKLSRELDELDKDSIKYKGVADEYNQLKDLKRTPEYQAKKKQCKELRQKLFHIKRLVKIYDQDLC